ncbi:MAG TPA: hypothetical protein VKB12_17465 [Pyrinomonadaceae bacterium]|nr:hypothetical protein [Pyrinomonadaceae bacterium]
MRAVILSLTLILSQASAHAASARQDADDSPRYLDANLVPAEGRAAADFVPRGWKLEGEEGELAGDLNKDGVPDKVLRLVEARPRPRRRLQQDDPRQARAPLRRRRGLRRVLQSVRGRGSSAPKSCVTAAPVRVLSACAASAPRRRRRSAA